MGIRFLCPNGHKLNVKTFLAGKRAICPECGTKVIVPGSPEASAEELPSSIVAHSRAVTDTASPSVVLALAETTFVAPIVPPEVESPPRVFQEPPLAAPGIPESLFAAPNQPAAAIDSGAMMPDDPHLLRRDRNRRNQVLVAVALLATVIVLAGVLIWVLRREPAVAPAEPTPPATTSGNMQPNPIEIVVNNNWRSAKARI